MKQTVLTQYLYIHSYAWLWSGYWRSRRERRPRLVPPSQKRVPINAKIVLLFEPIFICYGDESEGTNTNCVALTKRVEMTTISVNSTLLFVRLINKYINITYCNCYLTMHLCYWFCSINTIWFVKITNQ